MSRERLLDRRASESFDFEAMGLKFTATFSRFADGRVGEVFISNHKAGNAVDTLVRDLGIAASFALQHGADAEALRRAICRDSHGEPLGPPGVALDYIASSLPVQRRCRRPRRKNE